ncbi:MAG TPA: hypothetical protein PK961_16925 [bacterium]|nr:hypothetical protein [bacterium]
MSRALRLFPPVYPVGDWNSGSALESETELQKYLDVGIDMFIWGPSDSAPPETVLAWAETYDFYVFTHQGDVFDPLNPGHQYFRDFVAAYGDDPRILTNAVSGEGDLGDDPHEALGKIQAHRDLWGDAKPLWSYNACSYNFPAWAPLADMGGMDHYCVWAAQCNYNFPPFYWDRLENLGIYSEEIKLAAEPSPTWNWTQSIWNDFDINGNQVRCTTDDELRAQWYMVLSRGTKGVLWFYWRPDWSEDCPAEYTDEVLRVSRELAQLKETLLEGEMSLNGTIAYIEEEEAMIDVSATVSAESMVIFLQNMDYDLNLITPFQWREQSDIVIDVTPPDGFEPQQFRLVQDSGFVDLAWEKVAPGHWRFTLPTLSVAEAVLVIPEP